MYLCMYLSIYVSFSMCVLSIYLSFILYIYVSFYICMHLYSQGLARKSRGSIDAPIGKLQREGEGNI